MLYYGDPARTVVPREVLRRLTARMDRARALPREGRAALLTWALVEAGELAQALADRAFERDGQDGADPLPEAALALTVMIGRALCDARWDTGAAAWPAPDRLLAAELPPSVRVKVAEGYAHYALYPEAHAEAARRARGRSGRWFVIGIRSIGTSLAAAVAAACDARETVTVRPVGHPYGRRLRIAPALERRLRAAIGEGAQFAVVDEGPGLSGSSFEAVARWLEDAGLTAARMTFFPSHMGDVGPAATPERRRWWSGTDRAVRSFDEVVLPSLESAVERAWGPGSIEDASGGRWRGALRPGDGAPPPIFAMQERRKYLCHREGGSFVVRYAGLGRYEEETLERAEALAEEGWSPAPRLVFPGFIGTAVVGTPGPAAPSSEEIERYLAFRARALPAQADDGASPDQLLEMLRVNAAEALGAEQERWVDAHAPAAHESAALARVAVDGKLEAWEWARASHGRLWKLDATDHAFGHDLVGCQPPTWDLAGARVELGLPRERAVALATRLCRGADAASGAEGAAPAVLAFHEAAYLAHRIGRWTFALQLETEPQERARIEAVLERYKRLLSRQIGATLDSSRNPRL